MSVPQVCFTQHLLQVRRQQLHVSIPCGALYGILKICRTTDTACTKWFHHTCNVTRHTQTGNRRSEFSSELQTAYFVGGYRSSASCCILDLPQVCGEFVHTCRPSVIASSFPQYGCRTVFFGSPRPWLLIPFLSLSLYPLHDPVPSPCLRPCFCTSCLVVYLTQSLALDTADYPEPFSLPLTNKLSLFEFSLVISRKLKQYIILTFDRTDHIARYRKADREQ